MDGQSNKGEVVNVHSVLDAGVAGYTPMKKRRIAASLKRARFVRLASVTCSHERKSESAVRTILDKAVRDRVAFREAAAMGCFSK